MNQRNVAALRVLLGKFWGCADPGCFSCRDRAEQLAAQGVLVLSAVTEAEYHRVREFYTPDGIQAVLERIAKGEL